MWLSADGVDKIADERTMTLKLEIWGASDYGLRDWYTVCGKVRRLVNMG